MKIIVVISRGSPGYCLPLDNILCIVPFAGVHLITEVILGFNLESGQGLQCLVSSSLEIWNAHLDSLTRFRGRPYRWIRWNRWIFCVYRNLMLKWVIQMSHCMSKNEHKSELWIKTGLKLLFQCVDIYIYTLLVCFSREDFGHLFSIHKSENTISSKTNSNELINYIKRRWWDVADDVNVCQVEGTKCESMAKCLMQQKKSKRQQADGNNVWLNRLKK